jgi:hypothetical protein
MRSRVESANARNDFRVEDMVVNVKRET